MADDREDQTFELPDGRTLSYAEYGQASGEPAFYFHGHPGSRFEARLGHNAAKQNHVRMIAIDRPGFGGSSFQTKRQILDWPVDVAAFADGLGIDRFAVVGGSGGGPYALACAYALPERLTGCGVVSGVGPYDAPKATEGMRTANKIAFRYGSRLPFLPELIMGLMARQVRKRPQRVVERVIDAMSEADARMLEREEVRATLADILTESFRQGAKGPAYEMRLIGRPWGFRLDEIQMEVHLWQGEMDTLVPPTMARYMEKTIPNCRATYYPNEGHLLVLDHMGDITGALTAAWDRQAAE